jgi:hypothetical protein
MVAISFHGVTPNQNLLTFEPSILFRIELSLNGFGHSYG